MPPPDSTPPPEGPDREEAANPLLGSSVYQAFLAEKEEILRHKWIESQKAGKDIGFERALFDWVRYHRDGWREHRQEKRDK